MNPKLYAPNVHLFAFQLRNGMSSDDDNLLWQKCDEILDKVETGQEPDEEREKLQLTPRLDLHKPSSTHRVALLKDENNKVFLPFESNVCLDESPALKIKGFAYPLRLYDSYGLWLNLRLSRKDENGKKTENVGIDLLGEFNRENRLIIQGGDRYLGQTLLITAWLPEEHKQQDQKFLKKLADNCLKTFLPNESSRPHFNGDSLLFGSPIFEYGSTSQLPNQPHILIWFFRNSETDKKLRQCYPQLLELFFYRHKVFKAFQNSRAVYKQLNETYEKIEQEIDNSQSLVDDSSSIEDFTHFNIILKRLNQLGFYYVTLMRLLYNWRKTIASNAQKYNEKLEQLSSILPEENLSLFSDFSQKSCCQFQEQIKGEIEYFIAGNALLDKAIASIRDLVEIEQATTERQWQETLEEQERKFQEILSEKTDGSPVKLQESLREQTSKLQDVFKENLRADKGDYQQILQQTLDKQNGAIQEILQHRNLNLQEKLEQERELKEQSDRQLRNTIHAAGVSIGAGVGAGAIFASSYALIQPKTSIKPPSPSSYTPHPFLLSIIFSLLFGCLFGWGTWWCTRIIQRRPKQASKSNAWLED